MAKQLHWVFVSIVFVVRCFLCVHSNIIVINIGPDLCVVGVFIVNLWRSISARGMLQFVAHGLSVIFVYLFQNKKYSYIVLQWIMVKIFRCRRSYLKGVCLLVIFCVCTLF